MEMNVAAKVQNTLLKTKKPDFKELDIGFVTEPAKKMNGDYIYFLHDNYYEASVAVADVMGKGIPAALCMSMIKFGMDSLKHENTSPRNSTRYCQQNCREKRRRFDVHLHVLWKV